MIPRLLLTAYLALSAAALPHPQIRSGPVAKRTDGIPYSSHSIVFSSKVPRRATKQAALESYATTLRDTITNATSTNSSSVSLDGPEGAVEYSLNVTIGSQTFELVFDTGSSDLWVYATNLSCVTADGTPTSVATCDFGGSGFALNATDFHLLNYTNNFDITYGDGEVALGVAGTDTVTIGNLSVSSAEFAVVDEAYWEGDGVTSGIIGFATPMLTSVYYGSDAANDSTANVATYLPWFYQAVNESLVAPYFSVALERTSVANEEAAADVSNLGSVTFGGIPSNISVTDTTVTVPNINFSSTLDGTDVIAPAYYTLAADSFTFNNVTAANSSVPYIILDTGTTLVYVPDSVAAAFAAEISPAAIYDPSVGAYICDCDATVPDTSVQIGGQSFTFTAADLVYPLEGEVCYAALLPSGSDLDSVFVLGDRFLVNVLMTLNIETNEITLTQRAAY